MWGFNPSRRVRTVALGLSSVLLAFACGNANNGGTSGEAAPADQQVMRINEATEANSLDPGQQTYTYEAAVGRRVFQSLLLPKPDLTDVQPAAAKSWDVSSDGLTYTFHLRDNATWSDGKPVTAKDFVYGWKRILNPALSAGYADPFFDGTVAGGQDYSNVNAKDPAAVDKYLAGLGLSAPDDHTFVVKLQAPAGYFKWVATLWVGAPIRQDVAEQAAGGPFPSNDATKAEMWANDMKTVIGNGAFKISEQVAKDHITLVPVSSFYGGAPKLQKIIFYYITDANTAFAKYRTGDLDVLNATTTNVDVIRNDPVLSKQAKLYNRLATTWFSYNTAKAPLDNPKVRLALSKSIDRNQLANNVLHGTAVPFQTFIPKGMPGYDASNNTQSFDPTAAKKLLSDAGVTTAQLSQFKLLTRDTTAAKTINEFVSNQWQTNLGANIAVDVIDSKTVTSRIRKAQFDIYGPDGWIADYPDQQDWADIFSTGSCHNLNWGCPTLSGYDDLVKRADGGKNDSDRLKLYADAQKQVVDQAAVGFMYQGAEYNLIKPYVKGLQITPMDDQATPGDLFFNDVFIAKH
jgi:oligopeptide transport system substrate-binding protein